MELIANIKPTKNLIKEITDKDYKITLKDQGPVYGDGADSWDWYVKLAEYSGEPKEIKYNDYETGEPKTLLYRHTVYTHKHFKSRNAAENFIRQYVRNH